MHYTISLRIWHPTWRSADIVEMIAIAPKTANDVGTPRRTPNGRELDGQYKETYCVFPLIDKADGDFTNGIKSLIDLLRGKILTLQEMRASGGRVEVYVGVFSEQNIGFTMESKVLKEIAALGIDLTIEIYPGNLD